MGIEVKELYVVPGSFDIEANQCVLQIGCDGCSDKRVISVVDDTSLIIENSDTYASIKDVAGMLTKQTTHVRGYRSGWVEACDEPCAYVEQNDIATELVYDLGEEPRV